MAKESKEKKTKHKYTSIGGQALIEGIMMKGPERTAMSCRLPDKSISTELIEIPSIREKSKFFRIPIIRGIVGFIDSMITGYKTLMMSAERSGMDFEDEELSPFEQKLSKLLGDKLFPIIMAIAAVLGVVLAVGLFVYLPILLFNGFSELVNLIANRIVDISLYRALFEGVIKIAIFVLYIYLVSKMNDIKRVFKYHGAEHKSIFCYEAKLPLTVENVKKQSRFHPRCGTSFMIVMLLISIFISFMLSYLTPLDNNAIIWGAVKLLSIPIIMGFGYEFIKYAGKHDNAFTRICSAPGLWMQRLTTKEPDDDMIEVAIAALEAVDPLRENPFTESKTIITGAPVATAEDESADDEIVNSIEDIPQSEAADAAKTEETAESAEEFAASIAAVVREAADDIEAAAETTAESANEKAGEISEVAESISESAEDAAEKSDKAEEITAEKAANSDEAKTDKAEAKESEITEKSEEKPQNAEAKAETEKPQQPKQQGGQNNRRNNNRRRNSSGGQNKNNQGKSGQNANNKQGGKNRSDQPKAEQNGGNAEKAQSANSQDKNNNAQSQNKNALNRNNNGKGNNKGKGNQNKNGQGKNGQNRNGSQQNKQNKPQNTSDAKTASENANTKKQESNKPSKPDTNAVKVNNDNAGKNKAAAKAGSSKSDADTAKANSSTKQGQGAGKGGQKQNNGNRNGQRNNGPKNGKQSNNGNQNRQNGSKQNNGSKSNGGKQQNKQNGGKNGSKQQDSSENAKAVSKPSESAKAE